MGKYSDMIGDDERVMKCCNKIRKYKMKLAIVGGRDFNDIDLMAEYIAMFMRSNQNDEFAIPDVEIISGGAKGADRLGATFASVWELTEPTIFKPDWDAHGKAAGFIRNQLIVDACDVVLAFWDGKSRGTEDTINKAKKAKKPTFIVYYETPKPIVSKPMKGL